MTEVTRPLRPDLDPSSPGAQGLALLVRTQPPLVVDLEGRTIVIGRSEESDVVLEDRTVSSRHCQVAEEGGEYRVRDLGSRNGTRVNGVCVDEGVLFPGARLGVGEATLLCLARPRGASGGRERFGLVGDSRAMIELRAELACYSVRDAPVLIEGESGTGKELCARAIHETSTRRQGPFVSVNCGALTPELALSELFGHERGAFTGAVSRHRGAFERAHLGTLFLDEVGELDARVQAALLRTLETQTVERVGSEATLDVDVRLVAATNRDLRAATHAGGFRNDLYHRLAVLRLRVPALRERLSDIPALAGALLHRAGSSSALSADALELLRRHRWPGNVRELRNVLERACALAQGSTITAPEIKLDPEVVDPLTCTDGDLFDLVAKHGGTIAAAARSLGVPRTTLRDRIHKAQGDRA
jgi:DNA-binding NtrC family response regulator